MHHMQVSGCRVEDIDGFTEMKSAKMPESNGVSIHRLFTLPQNN